MMSVIVALLPLLVGFIIAAIIRAVSFGAESERYKNTSFGDLVGLSVSYSEFEKVSNETLRANRPIREEGDFYDFIYNIQCDGKLEERCLWEGNLLRLDYGRSN